MKASFLYAGALVLWFMALSSLSVAQTKNVSTGNERQANTVKPEKAKPMQKVSGIKAAPPSVNARVHPAQGKAGAVRNEERINAKAIDVPRRSKPTPVWQAPGDASKTKEKANSR